MNMLRKGKVISTLFPECKTDYSLLINKSTIKEKSQVKLIRYMDKLTGDQFVGKKCQNFKQFPKPAFSKMVIPVIRYGNSSRMK